MLEARNFLEWEIKVYLPAASSAYEIMKKKDTRSEPSEKAMIFRSPAPALNEIRIEKVRQILRASVSVDKYEPKDQRVRQFLLRPFRKGHCPVLFLNSGQYLLSI